MTNYQPDAAMLAACVPVEFDRSDYFDADEVVSQRALALAKASHDRREAQRVADAIERCEYVRKNGIRPLPRVWHTTNRG